MSKRKRLFQLWGSNLSSKLSILNLKEMLKKSVWNKIWYSALMRWKITLTRISFESIFPNVSGRNGRLAHANISVANSPINDSWKGTRRFLRFLRLWRLMTLDKIIRVASGEQWRQVLQTRCNFHIFCCYGNIRTTCKFHKIIHFNEYISSGRLIYCKKYPWSYLKHPEYTGPALGLLTV